MLEAKDNAIGKLTVEIRNLRAAYQAIRRRLLLNDGRLTEEALVDMERLKKDYFYSLALSIKLTRAMQGKSTNIRVDSLFERANQIRFTQWSDWILQQIDRMPQ